MDSIVRIHPHAGVERVGGRLVAVGPDDFLHAFEDQAGQVSPVAERIVELADGTRTLGRIVDALCDEFDVERARCASDALQFVKLLVEKKVLVLEPSATAPTR